MKDDLSTLKRMQSKAQGLANQDLFPLALAKEFMDTQDKIEDIKEELTNSPKKVDMDSIAEAVKDLSTIKNDFALFSNEIQEQLKKKLEQELVLEINKEELKGDKGEKGDKGDKGQDGKDGVNGKDGIDGKDANEENIIKVLDEKLDGNEIVNRINNLNEEDEKIDYTHIKGLEKYIKELAKSFNKTIIGGGARLLSNLLDVKINSPQEGDTLVYNSVTGDWYNTQPSAKFLTVQAKNTTGSTISGGSVVYITGSQGSLATIALADKDTEATSSKTFGIVSKDIADNEAVEIIIKGKYKFNGLDTSSFTEGTGLWLGDDGGLLQAPPAKPAHTVFIGWLEIKGNNSTIIVDVQNGYELDELHNVSITSPLNSQSLIYNSTTSLWENGWSWFDYVLGKSSMLEIPITGGTVQELSYTGTTEKRYRFVPEPYDSSQDIIYKNFTNPTLTNPLRSKLINI